MTDKEMFDKNRYLYGIDKLEPEALKVLYLAADSAGCSWYRGRQPANSMNAAYPKEINQVVSQFMLNADLDPGPEDPKWDIIIHQRQHAPANLDWAMQMKKKHNSINVYESDDDFWSLDLYSPSKKLFTPQMLQEMREYVSKMDYVVVSTEPLKKIYSQWNKNVIVIPNAIAVDIVDKIPAPPIMPGKIVIGWSGTATHYTDLKIAIPALVDVMKANKNVIFSIGGWPQCPLLSDIPSVQVNKLQWTDNMSDYYQTLKGRHIAIAPLADIKFNESKSNIKYLESAACGIPVIASDVTPYSKTITNNMNGILIKSTGSTYKPWRKALERLIADAEVRKKMGAAGRKNVEENYKQSNIAEIWKDFYIKIAKEKGLR